MAAIVPTDILFKWSVKTGTAGNQTTSTANGSLGTYISTSTFAGALNDVFDDVSGAENALNGILDYRCIFIHNNNPNNDLQNAVVWFQDVAGGANIAIAVDTTAATIITSTPVQALTATTETAPGAGVIGLPYSTAAITQPLGLSLGTIPKGFCRAVWLRRTTTNSSALSNDGVTISVAGDTGNL